MATHLDFQGVHMVREVMRLAQEEAWAVKYLKIVAGLPKQVTVGATMEGAPLRTRCVLALRNELVRVRYLPPVATAETEVRRGPQKTFQHRHRLPVRQRVRQQCPPTSRSPWG